MSRFFPQKWVDGGLTNSLPILPVGRTVTISPFSGRLDVSPQDKGQLDLYINIAKQDIMVSAVFTDIRRYLPKSFHTLPKRWELTGNLMYASHVLSNTGF